MRHLISLFTACFVFSFGTCLVRAQDASRFMWTYNFWTNSERPYKSIRDKIDAQIRNGAKPDDILSTYRFRALSKPANAQVVFAWGYAAWKAKKQFSDYDSQFQRIWKPRDAMARVPDPENYEWSRLRFLLETWNAPFAQYQVLGKRLLARNPNDYEVKYYFVRVLANVGTEDAKREAITYVRGFLKANPKKTSYYLDLGGIYELSWYIGRGRNSADGKQAIAIYKKYMTMIVKNDPTRVELERKVSYIQTMEGKWHSGFPGR